VTGPVSRRDSAPMFLSIQREQRSTGGDMPLKAALGVLAFGLMLLLAAIKTREAAVHRNTDSRADKR
jgi:hypothetical protein